MHAPAPPPQLPNKTLSYSRYCQRHSVNLLKPAASWHGNNNPNPFPQNHDVFTPHFTPCSEASLPTGSLTQLSDTLRSLPSKSFSPQSSQRTSTTCVVKGPKRIERRNALKTKPKHPTSKKSHFRDAACMLYQNCCKYLNPTRSPNTTQHFTQLNCDAKSHAPTGLQSVAPASVCASNSQAHAAGAQLALSLIHISEPTRPY